MPLTLRSFGRLLRVIVTRMPIRLASWTSLSKASNMPTLGFASEFNLNSPFPLRLRRSSTAFQPPSQKVPLETLTRTGRTQSSSSCRRSKESRSDRPTNLETRDRKRELDPAKADGTDHQLRVVTWPGVEVVVSWTLSSTSCSL